QPGDKVMQDETVLDIATDKVDSEVPSTAEGIVEEVLFNVNDVVRVGSIIAKIRTSIEEPAQSHVVNKPVDTPAQQTFSAAPQPRQEYALYEQQLTNYKPAATNGNGRGNRFYSPLVLNIAANEGISMTELETMHGTGNEGRVTKKDILQYVTDRKQRTGKQEPKTEPSSRKSYAAAEQSFS